MQLDKLELDLHPRSNAAALDLGFTLLRSHLGSVYVAWLALWIPLVILCAIPAFIWPAYGSLALLVSWWLKPLLERAPLYVLSRKVFGETVSWQQALRAWPKQLSGGWFRLLFWWRPFFAGRGLHQPIWQLEGARGAVAAGRRTVIAGNGTGSAAFWFGGVCAHFEAILQIGVVAFIGVFLSDSQVVNPFAYLVGLADQPESPVLIGLSFVCYAFSSAVMGPIYTACTFTLYLNRRATLEAWDIEIMLRQIKPPVKATTTSKTSLLAVLLVPIFALLMLAPSGQVEAAAPAQKCAAPDWEVSRLSPAAAPHDADQAKLRRDLERLFSRDELRFYKCEETWQYKKKPEDKQKDKSKKKDEKDDVDHSSKGKQIDASGLAEILKIAIIAAAVGLVLWVLYRYRDQLPGFERRPDALPASEIAGLDIRPETLPDDVPTSVRKLWAQCEHRAALGLLYRATLSKLVSEDDLVLTRGATEGDCLHLARQAQQRQQLRFARLEVLITITTLWLNGAYGDRWPDTASVEQLCDSWQDQFGSGGGRR